MAKKPRGKPPSQRAGHRSSGAQPQKPVDYNETLIDVAYVRALSPESPAPVVLVINADDDVGRRLAFDVLGSATVHEIDHDYRHRPRAATTILGVPSQEAVGAILSFQFPDAERDLDQPLPAGHFRVVVVDGGRIICRSRPIREFRIGADKSIEFIDRS
jgi:hypothetical protein